MIYASLVAGGAERIDSRGTVTAHRESDHLIVSVYFESHGSPGAYLYLQHTRPAPLVRALVGAALDLCDGAAAPEVATLVADADAEVSDAVRMLLADAASVLDSPPETAEREAGS